MKIVPGILAVAVTTTSVAFAQQPDEATPVAEEPPSADQLAQRLQGLLGRPGGLTAKEAARRATADSPSVRRARTHIAVADAERTQALVGFFPRLTLTAQYTRLSPVDQPNVSGAFNLVGTAAPEGPIPPGTPLVAVPLTFPVILDQYLLQANLTVPITDIALRTVHQYAAAGHSRRAAELEVEAADRGTGANAKLAYYDWVRARMQEAVAEQTLAQSQTHLDAARALEAGGRASRADVMAAQAQVANGELLVQRAKNAATSALDRLRHRMRDTKAQPYEIGESLPSHTPPLASLRDHYRRAMRKRPELEVLDEQARSLERQRKAAVAGSAPRLDAFGNVYYSNPNQRVFPQVEEFRATWDVGARLTWSPNDVPGSLAQADVFEARRAELVAQREELRDTVRDEVRQAYFALRDARAALATTERSLAAAEEAYRVRAERFRYGRASAVELADSEADLFRARLDRIDAQVGLRVAEVRLSHAIGR